MDINAQSEEFLQIPLLVPILLGLLAFLIYLFFKLSDYLKRSKTTKPPPTFQSRIREIILVDELDDDVVEFGELEKDSSQETTKQEVIDAFNRELEEATTIKDEYAALLQREEGSRLICFEEDLPYCKEKIKKALLIHAALHISALEGKEADERTSVYQNAFIALASFIPKEDAGEYKIFMSYLDKAPKVLEGEELINKEDRVEFAEGIVENWSKVDFKNWAEEIVERRKKLRTEWAIELMKYVSWFATINRLAKDS